MKGFFYHHSLSHSLLHFVLMEIFRSHDCNGGWKLILPEGQKRFKWFTPSFQYRLTFSHLIIIILLRRHAQFFDIILYQNFQEWHGLDCSPCWLYIHRWDVILFCLFSCLLFHLLRFFVCAEIIQLPHFCSASLASFVVLHVNCISWTSG